MSSHTWCYLIFSGVGGVGVFGGPKIKVAQNGLKRILVLEFLRSNEIFEILCKWAQPSIQATNCTNILTHRHHSDQISHSDR